MHLLTDTKKSSAFVSFTSVSTTHDIISDIECHKAETQSIRWGWPEPEPVVKLPKSLRFKLSVLFLCLITVAAAMGAKHFLHLLLPFQTRHADAIFRRCHRSLLPRCNCGRLKMHKYPSILDWNLLSSYPNSHYSNLWKHQRDIWAQVDNHTSNMFVPAGKHFVC